LAGESDDIHLGAFDDGRLVATLTLTRQGDAAKMRQVAVAPERHREGLGRKLVEFSEQVARGEGFSRMVLHARDTAVPFYSALGYATIGDPFVEVTIPHLSMEKRLAG